MTIYLPNKNIKHSFVKYETINRLEQYKEFLKCYSGNNTKILNETKEKIRQLENIVKNY